MVTHGGRQIDPRQRSETTEPFLRDRANIPSQNKNESLLINARLSTLWTTCMSFRGGIMKRRGVKETVVALAALIFSALMLTGCASIPGTPYNEPCTLHDGTQGHQNVFGACYPYPR